MTGVQTCALPIYHAILPSRGGDWKPLGRRRRLGTSWILPSRGGDWKRHWRVYHAHGPGSSPRGEVTGNSKPCGAYTIAELILPSRGGDWKPGVPSPGPLWRPRSSPRGEVTGNDCLHRLKSVRARSSPRGEVTGNVWLTISRPSLSWILPSRGGDWKPRPWPCTAPVIADPPLAGR